MAAKTMSNVKLGLFVLAGLLFLILLLYMIGKNENLFGNTFRLKARFENVQGLTAGNNVRYAGIQVGTVKNVNILSDTMIEVVMLVETRMKPYIHKNAVVAIGTDGLMGNRVLNITPSKENAPLVEEGDILATRKTIEIDEMLQTLAKTNNDVAIIASELKTSILRINNSSAVWEILNDKSLPRNLQSSLLNVRKATAKANEMVNDLHAVVTDIRGGKGSLGAILTDTSFARNLNQAILKIRSVGEEADTLTTTLNIMAKSLQSDLDQGRGTVNTLLKDSILAMNLQRSLENIREGTDGFNEIIEALKHNFLLRGYFRKLEKQKEKEQAPRDPAGN